MPFARRKQYFARIFNNKFIQGGYLFYERNHFTCHDPPKYPSAPSAGAAGTGRYGQPPGGSTLPRLRWVWELSLWRTTRLNLSLSWITASTTERGNWCMSAVTTSTKTVSPWTMGRNVSVSSLFPTPCCAGGFGQRYCRRIGNWKRRCLPPVPTGPNTARNVPHAWSGSTPQSASGNNGRNNREKQWNES